MPSPADQPIQGYPQWGMFGPNRCCCCLWFGDNFDDRDELGGNYQYGTGGVGPPWEPYPTFSNTNTTSWAISGGKAVGGAGDFLRIKHFNNLFAFILPYDGFVIEEFDLTYTGSGQVYIGNNLVLDFGGGKIVLNPASLFASEDLCLFPFVSGQTYKIRHTAGPGGINGVCRVWIDDYPVFSSQFSGSWGTYACTSGTMAIDNLRVWEANRKSCPHFGECFYPWGSPPPAQLQLDVGPATSNPPIAPCPSGARCAFPEGTYVLDYVEPTLDGIPPPFGGGTDGVTTSCLHISGPGVSYNPCACYRLLGSFNCYVDIWVKFGTVGATFSGTSQRITIILLNAEDDILGASQIYSLDKCTDGTEGMGTPLLCDGYSFTMESGTVIGFGLCIPEFMTITPLYEVAP